jgi:hypothetical protein
VQHRWFLVSLAPLAPFVVLAPRSAAAQSPATVPATVPTELARAIAIAVGGGYGRSQNDSLPAVIVGRTPDGFPRELLPGRGEVLGSVRFPSATWVIQRRADDDTTTVTLPAAAAGAGWRTVTAWGEPRGGFVPSESAFPSFFCHGDTSATFRETSRPGGGRYAIVTLQYARGPSVCTRQASLTTSGTSAVAVDRVSSSSGVAFAEARRPEMPPAPTLRAPAGVEMSGGMSSGGGGDHWSTDARAVTRLSADELVTQYGRQMVAQGWTLLPDQRFGGAALATLGAEKRDERGTTWRALLTAQRIAGGDRYDLSLRLVRPDGGM